ncbi:MAG: hypothetical protein ABI846_05205 [Rudaea sp.]
MAVLTVAAQKAEAEFEPGSRHRVLRNRLGIRSVREIQEAESDALLIATERLIDETAEESNSPRSTFITSTEPGWVKSIRVPANTATPTLQKPASHSPRPLKFLDS